MIWGKTNKEKEQQRQNRDSNWFAWRPVKLVSGRWCWLERLHRVFWANWSGCGYDYFDKSRGLGR